MNDFNYTNNSNLFKPNKIQFISKKYRINIKEEENNEDNDEIKRRRESSKLVKKVNSIIENKDQIDIIPFEEPEAPDINDFESDHEKEYEKWVLREIERIKIEIRKTAQKIHDSLINEERKNMNDEQIEEINKKKKKIKKKINFMQKYYHKGSFFFENNEKSNELLSRDSMEPVGDDLLDKTLLPNLLISRGDINFKKGKTKYTHLTNEDTTTINSRKFQNFIEKNKTKEKHNPK